MSTSIDWTFEGTWPHPAHWCPTPEGRLHYVDVGSKLAPPIVLVHGNPSWGYLYRHLIGPLVAAGHRVIVPDHLGFGRSDRASFHSVEGHARRFGALMAALQLEEVTLVVHDWGAPIALDWAVQRPELVRALVILNGFLQPPTGRVPMPAGLRLFRLPGFGELMVQGLNGIVRMFLFRAGVQRPERLDHRARAAYLAPHPSWSTRAGSLAMARQFPSGPEKGVAAWLGGIHGRLGALAERPALIAWAGRDPVFGPTDLARWRADFPLAEVLLLPDAGHFLQEDAPEALAPALIDFLSRPSRQCA